MPDDTQKLEISVKELERLRSVERAAQEYSARMWTTRERNTERMVVASTESDWEEFNRAITPRTREDLLEEFYRQVQSHVPSGNHIGDAYCNRCGEAFEAIGAFDRGE